MRKELARLRAQSLRGLKQRVVELARRLGDHQNHLEKRSDENECDFRFIVRAKDCHQQCAEGRRRHVPEKINERFE